MKDVLNIEWPKINEWGTAHIDRTGKKYNKLTVLQEGRVKRTDGHSAYRYYLKCLCDCGNETITEKQHVLKGNILSCGCFQEETRKKFFESLKKPYGQASFNETYYSYKRGAKRRGYSFELTEEQFREIATKPCIYCGDSLTQCKRGKTTDNRNGEWYYTGIDRYDNTKGYTLENSVPCCKKCNAIKTNMSIDELAAQIEKIYAHKEQWGKRGE